MNGINPIITEAIKMNTGRNRSMCDFLLKLISIEFEDKVPLSNRKNLILEFADNYRDEERQ